MVEGAPRVDISRLKRRKDFLRVAARQRKCVTAGLIVQSAPMPPVSLGGELLPVARVGFTVSKKVGNAVKRNRARRRLRAAADSLMGGMAAPGTDYVVIGRVQTLERPFDALLRDLETALKRLMSAPPSRRHARSRPRKARRGVRSTPNRSAVVGDAKPTDDERS